MVYAFVIHMRLVPGLRGKFAFNLSAIIAYGSILMTYFGVNFYLSGLHSYASGDQIMSVKFIGITCFLILVLAFFAYRKYKIFYGNSSNHFILSRIPLFLKYFFILIKKINEKIY